MLVSDAQVDAFQADGAVVLRALLTPAEIERLRAGIEKNLAHPSPRAKVASERADPGWFIEDFCCWQENPHYRHVIFESALGRVGAALMRSRSARRSSIRRATCKGRSPTRFSCRSPRPARTSTRPPRTIW